MRKNLRHRIITFTCPAYESYIDANLTPIVNYQYKNGAGTDQLLALDAIRQGVVACSNHLMGNHPTKLFVSNDEGKTWTDIYDRSLGSLRIMGT